MFAKIGNKINMRKNKIKLISSMTIYGTLGLVRRHIPYSSGIVAFARGAIGALFLFIIQLLKKEKFSVKSIKENLLPLSLSGVFLGVNWILFFESYNYAPISVATVCYYMAPIFVVLASIFLFKEKLSLKKSLYCLSSFIGMFLISGITEMNFTQITGVLLSLGAAVLYAVIVLLNKKVTNISDSQKTIIQLFISAITMLPYVLLTNNIFSLEFTATAIIMLFVAGVLHTGVAYWLYFGSISHYPHKLLQFSVT